MKIFGGKLRGPNVSRSVFMETLRQSLIQKGILSAINGGGRRLGQLKWPQASKYDKPSSSLGSIKRLTKLTTLLGLRKQPK
jgi:hypothetical protein